MNVCLIPARGGSKRIPRKNIRPFLGSPMIAWSIRAASTSGLFDRIVVSTDDKEIASVAQLEGAETPFLRDPDLADDYTPTVPVVADACRRLEIRPDSAVCCLYATAPFVRPQDLIAGREALLSRDATYVMAVTSFPFPIQRALRRHRSGAVEMIDPSMMQVRSQDLEDAWHDAGQFYWARAESWLAGRDIFGDSAYGIAVPRHRVQDIDTEEDWQRAEHLMRAINDADTDDFA